jgi:hypothetical protein
MHLVILQLLGSRARAIFEHRTDGGRHPVVKLAGTKEKTMLLAEAVDGTPGDPGKTVSQASPIMPACGTADKHE